MMRKNIKKLPRILHFFRLGMPFWIHLLDCFVQWRVRFATVCSDTLGGTPVDRVWHPFGHPWSDFLDLMQELRAILVQMSKIPEQQMAPATPSKNKQDSNSDTHSQSKQIVFTFIV